MSNAFERAKKMDIGILPLSRSWVILSISSIDAVEWPALKPYWLSYKRLCSFKYVLNCLKISFSKILYIEGRSEIGRWFYISFKDPFLWIGITLAIFSFSGNIPVFRDWLKIHVRAGIISVLITFINLIEISSKPVLDLFGRSLIILSIEISFICLNWNVQLCVPVRKSLTLMFLGIFMFLARLGPMSAKYLQNLLAMLFNIIFIFFK